TYPRSCSRRLLFTFLSRPPSSLLFPYTTLFRSPRAVIPPASPVEGMDVFYIILVWSRSKPQIPVKIGRGFLAATGWPGNALGPRSEEHTSELQSRENLVCRLLLEKKKKI